jgi:hypothetical protein
MPLHSTTYLIWKSGREVVKKKKKKKKKRKKKKKKKQQKKKDSPGHFSTRLVLP